MIEVLKSGVCRTVQAALDFLEANPEEEKKILVHPGIYEEQVTVRIPGVELGGEKGKAEETVITCGLGGKEILEDGMKRGTFRTYTMFVDADDVTLRDLTIENSAGPGTRVGQAIALYADGDRMVIADCRLLGWQDTLFTAPLPPKEIEKNGFIGPKQYAPRTNGRQYYKNCYIEGEVDFIFGGATAYFENCTIFSKDVDREPVKGYVTAPSTPEGLEYGYVMEGCRFTSNCPEQSVFLGRPWREWGQTVLLRCEIGPHIKAEGWDDWGKEMAHRTAVFAEYGCTGPGAALENRADWSRRLTEQEAEHYTRERVLAGADGWRP
ncbi:MAG: pectinesterase family protein [Lachnospiraceae bacterium]|nr:pectinesterase family protein [Lachnospiraceae bacterium]